MSVPPERADSERLEWLKAYNRTKKKKDKEEVQ